MSLRVLQLFFVFFGVVCAEALASAQLPSEDTASFPERYSLYDILPQGPDNPVMARAADNSFVITRAEFRGFLASVEQDEPASLAARQRRWWLDALIDQHLLLSRAYAERLDRLPKVVEMMASTRRILLKKALLNRELGNRPKTEDAYEKKTKELEDAFFHEHPIQLEKDGLAHLKNDLRRLYPENNDEKPMVDASVLLARAGDRVVTEAEFLAAVHEGAIGRVNDQELENVTATFVRDRLGDEFLIGEAQRQELDRADDVRRALQLNRNTLVYMEVNNRLMDEARKDFSALKNAETEMKTWFEANRLTIVHRDRSDHPLALTWEKDREVILDWFMEHLRDEARRRAAEPLRRELKIEVSD